MINSLSFRHDISMVWKYPESILFILSCGAVWHYTVTFRAKSCGKDSRNTIGSQYITWSGRTRNIKLIKKHNIDAYSICLSQSNFMIFIRSRILILSLKCILKCFEIYFSRSWFLNLVNVRWKSSMHFEMHPCHFTTISK